MLGCLSANVVARTRSQSLAQVEPLDQKQSRALPRLACTYEIQSDGEPLAGLDSPSPAEALQQSPPLRIAYKVAIDGPEGWTSEKPPTALAGAARGL